MSEAVTNKNIYDVSRLRRAIVQFISGRILQAVGRAALLLILVRLLAIEDFGAYMLLLGLAEMMLQLSSFGIRPTARRYLPQLISSVSASRLNRFVAILMLLQLLILSAIVIALWQFWSFIAPQMGFTPQKIGVTQIALLLFLLVPAERFICEMLESLFEQGRSQLTSGLIVYGRIVAVLAVVASPLGITLETVLWIDIAVNSGGALLGLYLLRQSLRTLRRSTADEPLPMRDILRFAWHMGPTDLMASTSMPGALRLALANSIGIIESGLFAFLQSLQKLVGNYLPGTLLRNIVMPMMLSRAQSPDGKAILQAGTRLLIKTNLLIIALCAVIIAVYGNTLVALLSDGKFPHAGLTLLLLFMALAASSQRIIIEMVMQVIGKTATLRATALIAPISLGLVWLFAGYGLNVAILIIAGAMALANAIAVRVLSQYQDGFRLDWQGQLMIYLSAACGIGLGFTLMVFDLHPLVSTLIAALTFVLIVVLAKPYDQHEFAVVEKAAGPRLARWSLGLLYRNRSG